MILLWVLLRKHEMNNILYTLEGQDFTIEELKQVYPLMEVFEWVIKLEK